MRAATTQTDRRLRRDSTDVEHAFWQAVRNRQVGGCKFRRQVPIGPYVADFLCVEHRLVVELDGGQHDEERDADRTRFLEAQGYRVLRFWNNDVIENMEGVLTAVLAVVTAVSGEAPSPNPLPQAGEGS